MRFRPHCFDYHTEATNLLRDEREETGKIWIVQRSSVNDMEKESDLDEDDGYSSESDLDGKKEKESEVASKGKKPPRTSFASRKSALSGTTWRDLSVRRDLDFCMKANRTFAHLSSFACFQDSDSDSNDESQLLPSFDYGDRRTLPDCQMSECVSGIFFLRCVLKWNHFLSFAQTASHSNRKLMWMNGFHR
jgi:hypothetical protein